MPFAMLVTTVTQGSKHYSQCHNTDLHLLDLFLYILCSAAKELGLMDPLVTPAPMNIVSTSQAPPIKASNNYDDQERYTLLKCCMAQFLHYFNYLPLIELARRRYFI